ncbi:MAG: thiamine diphosphokinase [Aerococcus suis]|nr:thiamine diphosphokinase [Aerococcus suis]MDY4646222.1 thiamine diphosphokinase [Aerococcus suis]
MQVFMIGSGPFDEAYFKQYVEDVMDNKHDEAVYVGIDLGAKRFVEMDETMVFALGDFDSVSETDYQHIVDNANDVIRLNPMKDETDMQAGLNWVIDHYPNAEYHLFGALGGRVDHSLCNLWMIFMPEYQRVLEHIHLIHPKNWVNFLSPGQFQVNKVSEMTYLSFVLMTPVQELTLTDVVYPLDRATYHYPMALISNEFLANHTQMSGSFKTGLIAVIQSRD